MDVNLESKKFPTMGYLRKMGVDFKPSLMHKVLCGHKVFNIMNDPVIAAISPRIDCTWEGGAPPKFKKAPLSDLEHDKLSAKAWRGTFRRKSVRRVQAYPLRKTKSHKETTMS